jgi:hypothetical protein
MNNTEQMRYLISLLESKSADLYHGTSIYRAYSILDSNYLEVNIWGAHDHPNNIFPTFVKGESDAASLTRDFQTAIDYAQNHDDDYGYAVLVFDQALLVRDLGRRIRPVSNSRGRGRGSTASEELAFGGIKNVKKYLKQIYILPTTNDWAEEYEELAADPLVKIIQSPKPTARMQDRQIGITSSVPPEHT